MAIFKLLKIVITYRDQGVPVCAIFMDLSKAFDSVDHGILINKLDRYGIRGNALNLVESYLKNRVQSTQINQLCFDSKTELQHTSAESMVEVGVPQGSVLGPLLFITYINDFPEITKHPMVLFADDSTVIIVGKDINVFESDINNTLGQIENWLTLNNLKLNIDKTKTMIFSKNNSLTLNIVNQNGKNIENVTATKFLGIHIDINLKWDNHVEIVCTKLKRFSYALYNLGKIANKQTVLTAYHAYVTSTLRYGVIFWGNSSDNGKVFIAQKRCLRAVCKLRQTDSCKEHFRSLNILTFPCLYIYEVIMFLRNNMEEFEQFTGHRHQNKFITQPHRTTLYSKSILAMAPKLYNKLPKALLNIPNPKRFKSLLIGILMDKCYYTLEEYLTDKNIIINDQSNVNLSS